MWNREPALIVALIGALIALLIAFGLHLSAEQVGAVMALVTAALGLVTRSRVTPAAVIPAAPVSS